MKRKASSLGWTHVVAGGALLFAAFVAADDEGEGIEYSGSGSGAAESAWMYIPCNRTGACEKYSNSSGRWGLPTCAEGLPNYIGNHTEKLRICQKGGPKGVFFPAFANENEWPTVSQHAAA